MKNLLLLFISFLFFNFILSAQDEIASKSKGVSGNAQVSESHSLNPNNYPKVVQKLFPADNESRFQKYGAIDVSDMIRFGGAEIAKKNPSNPDDGRTASLITAEFTIPESNSDSKVLLELNEEYELETENDFSKIYIRRNAGEDWILLDTRSGAKNWGKTYLDLTNYKGNSIQLKFELKTGVSFESSSWAISDINLIEMSKNKENEGFVSSDRVQDSENLSAENIPGLIAYYPFNGNTNDESGSGYHGTNYGATLALDRFGNPNKAYYFNGTSSRIQTNSKIITAPFTVSVWLKTDQNGVFPYSEGTIISTAYNHGGYGKGILLMTHNKVGSFAKFPATTSSGWGLDYSDSTKPMNDNNWHQMVGTWDGTVNEGGVKWYIDGKLVMSGKSRETSLVHDFNLKMGHTSDGPWNYYLKGSVDDLRIYNRVLNTTEVQELYHEGGWDPLPASISLLSPNGGETLIVGQVDTIRWSSSNVQNVKLEYSTDGGVNWTTIIDSIPSANLNYLWEIPHISSSQCKVRISDVSNPSIADTSNNLFTIAPQFTEQTSISLTGGFIGSVVWGDYDNDGDLDILLTGGNSNQVPVSKVYKNNGDGTFTEQTSISLTGVWNGSVAWGDYDNDGDLDILLTGYNLSTVPVSKIYKNNGDGTFIEETSISLTGVGQSQVAWGDYDNDGDLDILLTGISGSLRVSKIYKNNGDGTFAEQTSISLTGVYYGSVAWGDYDNDGDLDILLTGQNSNNDPVSKIYKNNGDGTFTEQTSISLTSVYASAVAWGDYDNDGDLDILLTGISGSLRVSKIYKNNGDGAFAEQTSISLTGIYNSSVAWGDYDNDGDLDILLAGRNSSNVLVSKIYKNNGDGTFAEQTSISLTSVGGSVAWGDYDNDGDLDILLTGSGISRIYKNNNTILNTVPNAPTNLTSTVNGNTVTFNWNKSTDNETPQNGLHYNVVIGTTANSINTLSPMADKTTGFRRVVRLGNSQTNSWTIKNLPLGTYYWSVQAIDGAYAGSQFASVQSFTSITSVSIIKPNGGEILRGGEVDTIKWTSTNVTNVKLEYTTNNGSNWLAIIANTSANAGKYVWTVPNTPSTNCKVRISDINISSLNDLSDNVFTILPQAPAIPLLASPANNSKGVAQPTTAKWYKSAGAQLYKLEIATDAAFTNTVFRDTTIADSLKQLPLLSNYSQYYWRVKASNAGGESAWSTVWNFKTLGNPYAVNLIQPLNNAIEQPASGLTFKWTKAKERIETIQKYQFQMSTDSLFASTFVNDSTLIDTTKVVGGMGNLTKYFWRVRAQNQTGWGDWSETWNFKTFENIRIVHPNGNIRLPGNSLYEIKWAGSTVTNVKLEYTTNNGFNWISITLSTPANTGKYSWRVPEIVSDQCKVRVSGLENPLVTDESDSVFSIYSGRPEINFAGVTNFQSEVVYPVTGSDETFFEYMIRYSSQENKQPGQGFPKVILDFNGDGNINGPGEGEFNLSAVDPGDTVYSDGKLYSYLTTLPAGSNHKVKFRAVDLDGDTALVSSALLNYRNVPVVLGGLPDAYVQAEGMLFSNANPNPSEPFTISTKVYNRSDQNMQNLKVKFYKDTQVLGETVIPYLSHRTETTVSLETVINEAGFYAMQVIADSANVIVESNELNNTALRPLLVGTSVPVIGTIVVEAGNISALPYSTIYIRGKARYSGVFGGSQVVMGGRVKITLNGNTYYGTTNSRGEFIIAVGYLPSGNYSAALEVTDTRLTGTTAVSISVQPNSTISGKDIAIQSMFFSNGHPVSGQQVNINVTAWNSGTEPLTNVVVELFTDYVLRDSIIIPSLAPGSFLDLNFTRTFSGVGRHPVLVVADRLNKIVELNECNNGTLEYVEILPDKPDLAVTNIILDKIIKVNRNTVIEADVENIGGTAINTPFIVYFEVDGVQIGQKTINTLSAGNRNRVSVTTQFTTTGNKVLRVYADHSQVVVEGDETNNIAARLFFVSPLLPDLDISTGIMLNIPLMPGAGDSVQLKVSVKNIGETSSPATQVKFSVNGTGYTSIADVPQLLPSEEVVIASSTSWVPNSVGGYVSKAEIDFANQIPELDSLNNGKTLTIFVGNASDLALDSANSIKASKFYAKPGETVRFSAVVNNHGNIAASSDVEFYYYNLLNQRIYINSTTVSVPANDTARSGEVSFIMPFAPVSIYARLINSQPPDYNPANNAQTLLVGDRAPVITNLETLSFAEDSSLTINLNDHVFDGGDSSNTLVWEFIQSANIRASYQQSTQTVVLSATPNFYGTENITVKVRDPQLNEATKTVTINVIQVIDYPGVPILAAPLNGSTGQLLVVNLSWWNSSNSNKYHVQVSKDSLFINVSFQDSTVTDTTRITAGLESYKKYFWRVRGINSEAVGAWSTVWNFKTLGDPYASNLITPLDASINQPLNGLTFKWTKAKERIESIQKYQLQISTDSLFASTFVNDSTLTDTTKIVSGMGYLTKYFWRVRAQNQTGWGDWSNTWRFTTIIEKPSVPLLASPVNNATQQLQPVVLKWRHSVRVEKYTLEVSESSNFTTLFLVDSTMTDTMRTLPQLQTPKTYYWRVKARNIGGTSEYSTVWNFRTLGFPIAVNLIAPANGSVNLPINGVLLKWSTAGEQTLGSVTSGGKGAKKAMGDSERSSDGKEGKAKGDIEQSSDQEGRNTTKSGNLFATGSANPASGIESIGKYWLEIKTDTSSATLFYSDSTLTDTTKLMSGFGYLKTYFWRVKANNEVGWGSFSGWFRFTTVTERPGITVLSSPANNSLGLIQPLVMKWRPAIRAERYTLEVSENNNFSIFAVRDTNITDTTKVLSSLSPLKDYYWRVYAVNAGGRGDTSSVWSFKTKGTPATLNLVYPENNAVNIPTSLTFRWNKGHDMEIVSRYWFELVIDTTAGIVVRDSLLTDTLRTVSQIQSNVNYYWRVKAKNEAGWGQFTPWNRFTTVPPVPGQVVLSLPVNNTLYVPVKPVFKWRKVTGATQYHLQVATDLNFANIVLVDSMLTDTTKALTSDSLNYKTKYYWRVRALNAGGTGAYSTVWNFSTKKKPIATPTALTAIATAVKKVTLAWTDNSDNELGFIILRKSGDSTSTATLVRIDSVGANITEFIDSTVTDTSYYSYKMMAYNADTLSNQSNYATVFTLTGIKELAGDIPKEFTLYQNYPNPFNPSTIIRFAIPKDAHVEIELYSIHGELVQKLVSEDKQAGYYEISLELPAYASGVYFYRIVATHEGNAEPFVQTRKLILMK